MPLRLLAAAITFALLAAACSEADPATLTVYSGRSENLVGPLFEKFTEETGIKVAVRYAGSTDLAATLREEGSNSPADVFFAQDPASLGAVAESGLFSKLAPDIMAMVDSRFSDPGGRWVGTSGRARVVVYDSSRLSVTDLPSSVAGFAAPEWKGRIAIAPTNGSFLAFVAAMLVIDGEAATSAWLEALAANNPGKYEKNSAIVAAVDRGEIEVGLVNHYYLLRLQAEQGTTAAANHFLTSGGPGSLVMPAGIGVLATSDQKEGAERLIAFLLSAESQEYFARQTFEYPLAAGIPPLEGLPPLESLGSPLLDLSAIAAALDLATDLVAAAGLL